MRRITLSLAAIAAVVYLPFSPATPVVAEGKVRIAVVSSYHPEYLWSQDTNRGVVAALRDFGYLDDDAQGERFTREYHVESSRAVIRKLWMDTKRKSNAVEIEASVTRIVNELAGFQPDILLLGDDNATNYVGNQFVDTDLPVVFWGVNGNPLKYDLLDTLERPGHNVTGVYQAGYLREGVQWVTKLLPGIRKMAVLADSSATGRSKARELQALARAGKLPLELVEVVVTNSLETWKTKALELQERVDAFFVLNHNTLRNSAGKVVDQLEVGAWYLQNIRKPDIAHERQFVVEGMLAAVDDSGLKQGYEAMRIAHRILANGENPASISVYAPDRGPFVVNMERARMLGIDALVADNPLVEELIPTALALRHDG